MPLVLGSFVDSFVLELPHIPETQHIWPSAATLEDDLNRIIDSSRSDLAANKIYTLPAVSLIDFLSS